MPNKPEANPVEKFWFRVVESWRDKAKAQRKTLERYASAYRSAYYPRTDTGEDHDDDNGVTRETNYIFAFADTMVAQIVPPNPAVTINANQKSLKEGAKFREALVNRNFAKEQLGKKMWGLCTRATVWPRAFLKTVWSPARKRPIYRVLDPQYVFFDLDAETWEDIRYVIEVVPLTRADFDRRVKKPKTRGGFYRSDAKEEVSFGAWPKWLKPEADMEDRSSSDHTDDINIVRDGYEWTVVYEVYDFKAKKFYHFADGVERALMVSDLPYKHLKNPYKLLTFNDNLKDLGGLSDAELVFPTLERLNELQTLKHWFLKTAIPVTVIHEGLVDDPEAFTDAYESIDGPGQTISLPAKAAVGINQVIGVTPTPTLPIEWGAEEQSLRSDVEFVLGMPAYTRGAVGQSDVATELALTDTANKTRNARRQKEVHLITQWAAEATIQLFMEFMEEEEEIPTRLLDGVDGKAITRELMEFGDISDDPWAYDYTAHPFSASELNDVVKLKQFETLLPVLLQGIQTGDISSKKLFEQLTELMHMPGLMMDEDEKKKQQEAQAAEGGGIPGMDPNAAAAMMAGGGADGMGMPPEAQAALTGGEVMSGTGAQAVPGGMEGGTQPAGAAGGLAGLI